MLLESVLEVSESGSIVFDWKKYMNDDMCAKQLQTKH